MRKTRKSTAFKTLGSSLIHRARLFDLRAVRMRAPDGRRFRHQIIHHPGAAVIIPMLPGNRFVLIRQFRTAVGRKIWEFPAGTLEKKETPIACAKREIIEEIGYRAKTWKKLVSFYPAPGISTEFMHVFIAADLVPAEMCLDQDEFIEKRIVSFSRLQKMTFDGTMVDAKTMLSFLYFCRKFHRAKRNRSA
ncbi:MAG: NUDIX hydrolase [Candidatus Omnitrophica bacterium]|nr:NUDIX hydrolase [Candidatus Omnitrophota bacterium]